MPSRSTIIGSPACVIHCRVSTTKQAYEGESLDVQASICATIAASKGWRIAHEPWKESFSGRKESRPAFQDILAFIDANPGSIGYYLFRSIDRATRGGSFSYEGMKRALQSRGVEMVDSHGIIQPSRNTLEDLGFEYPWSISSPSEIAEVVVATSAKVDLTNILTRLIGQEIRLRQRGYKIRQATDGFVNERIVVEGRKSVIESPDPERARYYIAMFELRASGQFTDVEICERINAMGFRTRQHRRWDAEHRRVIGSTGGTPLTEKRLQEIIRRSIYCGIICEKWTNWKPVKAAYDGLVSIETFNAANRGKVVITRRSKTEFGIGYGVAKGRSKENPLFPLRKVIVCPHCRKPFLGSSPRGRSGQRFPTYHCSRQHTYLGIPKAAFEETVASYVSSLRFKLESIPVIRNELVMRFREQQGIVAEDKKAAKRTMAELALQKSEAIKAFAATTSDAMRRGLEAEVERLEGELTTTTAVKTGLKVSQEDIDAFLADAAMIMEHPSLLLDNAANTPQLEALYQATFEERPSYAEIANGTPKLAWIFRAGRDFDASQSVWVRPDGLSWNQIEETVERWKEMSIHLRAALATNSIL